MYKESVKNLMKFNLKKKNHQILKRDTTHYHPAPFWKKNLMHVYAIDGWYINIKWILYM